MKYGVFNAAGLPVSFWDDELTNAEVPTNAVALTGEQWASLALNPGARKFVNGVVLPYEAAIQMTSDQIDRERDRRIAAGFTFGGKLFQAREQDLRNINGAATGAALAMMQGAQAGNPRWQGGDTDFGWIAADNAIVPMDVVTMVNFGRAAMTHVERLTMVGRSLKDRLAAGETLDISSDALWGE